MSQFSKNNKASPILDVNEIANSIKECIQTSDDKKARALLGSLHPVDAAACVTALKKKEQKLLIQLLTPGEAADLVDVMSTNQQASILSELNSEKASRIVEEMASDEVADALAAVSKEKRNGILESMKPEEAQEARSLLSYPQNSAGALMSTNFVALQEDMTVQESIVSLRNSLLAQDPQRFNYVYVLDKFNKMYGVLQMRDLVIREPSLLIRDIAKTRVISVHVRAQHLEIAGIFRKYNLLALPVVNDSGLLIGVITADKAADLIREIATKEFLKLQGVSTDETREMPWWPISKKRVSWLSLNIFLNIMSASVIAFFQDTLKAVIAIAVFLPIISDMSGCSGMQSVAVSIRDLALEKIAPKDFLKVLYKEFIIGTVNGLILGIEIGLVSYLWKGQFALGIVVAMALWINTILAVCVGGIVPLILKRFKLDPAIASGPILTTVTDMMGFALVLGLAAKFLIYLV